MLALVDLDGTLADYDSAMTMGMLALASPDEIFSEAINLPGVSRTTLPAYLQERERVVRSLPGFYGGLSPIPSGFAVMKALEAYGYTIHIATKAPVHNTAIAVKEKIEWCGIFLPGYKVTVCADKGFLIGDILFDDWPGYMDSWLENNPNGFGIMPSRRWNSDFSHPRCIRIGEIMPANFLERIKKHNCDYGIF